MAGLLSGCVPELHYAYTSYSGMSTVANPIVLATAGPLVNIIIGSIGFYLLKQDDKHMLLNGAITFFWCRQILILFRDMGGTYFTNPIVRYSDEQKISEALNLPTNTASIILGITGMVICTTAVFKYMPARFRKDFIMYGLSGCFCGYIFWFKFLGPYLLP